MSPNDTCLSRLVFPVEQPAKVNYLSREHLERRFAQDLATYSAVVVKGPSGIGKSSLVQYVLERCGARQITVIADRNGTWEGLLSEARNTIRRTALPWPERYFERLLEFAPIRLVLSIFAQSPSALRRQDAARLKNEVLDLVHRCRVVLTIERAERLNPANLESLVEILNDMGESFPAQRQERSRVEGDMAAMIVCTASRLPIDSKRVQASRYATIVVDPMSDGEMRRMVEVGGELLNVTFSNAAIATIIRVSRSVPLACSELVLNALLRLKIERRTDQCHRVEEDDLGASAHDLGRRKGDFLHGWMKHLSDPQAPEHEILRRLWNAGHDCRVSDADPHKPGSSFRPRIAELEEVLDRLGREAAQGEIPGLIRNGDRVRFAVPFLYEALHAHIKDQTVRDRS